MNLIYKVKGNTFKFVVKIFGNAVKAISVNVVCAPVV